MRVAIASSGSFSWSVTHCARHENRASATNCSLCCTIPRSGWFQGEVLSMHVTVLVQPLIALVFGILVLVLPRILNYLVAIYLILIGAVGLFPHLLERYLG